MNTTRTDKETLSWVFYGLALLLVLAMAGMEYLHGQQRDAVQKLATQERSLQTKVAQLKQRAQAAETLKPQLAALEAQLLKPEQGNTYAQLLMETVKVQRQTNVDFPTYSFAEAGAAGKFPRYSVTGSAAGTDEEVFAFIAGLEQGPWKVQVTTLTYTTTEGAAGDGSSAGNATANLTLLYTTMPNSTKP